MANYYYNGVELPQLPEWDKTTYPYAFIYDYGNGNYSLIIDRQKITYKPGTGFGLNSPPMCAPSDGKWGEFEEARWEGSDLTMFFECDKIVWVNHDIINTADGSVFLAASDPVPAPIPIPDEGHSVYSFNGVTLPALPKWDKTVYPYAFIYDYGNGSISFVLSNIGVIAYNPNRNSVTLTSPPRWRLVDGAWGEFTEGDENPDDEWGEVSLFYDYDKIVWTNHDIVNTEDGSVYLPASVPVPYIEWKGKDIYLCRNGLWLRRDAVRKMNGEWVTQDAYLI